MFGAILTVKIRSKREYNENLAGLIDAYLTEEDSPKTYEYDAYNVKVQDIYKERKLVTYITLGINIVVVKGLISEKCIYDEQNTNIQSDNLWDILIINFFRYMQVCDSLHFINHGFR